MDSKGFLNLGEKMAGLSRRDFVKYLVTGTALSVAALEKANAGIYQSITSLNQQYIKNESPDGVYWDAVGKHFLFQDGIVMMNNGTVGPMPKTVFNSLIKCFRMQVENPYLCYSFLPRKEEEVRNKVANFIGCLPEELVLTRNTTEGMNFVANGLDMKAGDEVLLSDMEHPGGIHPWRLKAERYGIKIKEVKIGLSPENVKEFVESFEKAITPKTKIISISHTVYISGLIAPLKELSEMAHSKGVMVLADSAHGIGMLDLNMNELGVDFLTSSPYKWMGAPTGIGVLFIRKDVQDKLWPTIASSGWDTYPDSRKFETLSQRADALTVALGEAVDFQNVIGKSRIERRIKALSGYLKQELKKIKGVKLHTSEDPYLSGGLTAFSVSGVEPEKVVDYVREKYNIVVRTIGSEEKGTYGVRVSTPIYVTYEDIDRFLEGIRTLVAQK